MALGGTQSPTCQPATDDSWMRVEQTMWMWFLTTSNIPMNRKLPTSHQRPIFQVNRQNVLNLPALKTENYSMPNKNTKTSHRVVLVKGEHHWRFEWSPGQEIPAVKAITEIAKSTETDFDWFDAAMVCHEMSKITSKAA
jgi:hypothetical protein